MVPSTDGVRATYAFPQTDAQKVCIDKVFKPTGITFENVTNARNGLRYCDAVTLPPGGRRQDRR